MLLMLADRFKKLAAMKKDPKWRESDRRYLDALLAVALLVVLAAVFFRRYFGLL